MADFGGVGGLGYLVAPGSDRRPPDPTEYLPFPSWSRSTASTCSRPSRVLEEVTYFDEAKLIAVDHPGGTRGLSARMMAISAPPPFEVFCSRSRSIRSAP